MSQFGAKPENAGTYWDDLRVMLKKMRLACGFSHEDVAATLGVSRPTYSYYELGKSLPDMVMLVALARIFEISPECLLYPEEFTNLETARQRAPKKVMADPKHIGELSTEERRMVAKYRLNRTGCK